MTHRRLLAPLALAGVFAVIGPPAGAAQEPSGEGCWGQFVSFFARLDNPEIRNYGAVVSGFAHEPGPLGTTVVPTYKAIACGD
jgi:hypothetical protein